MREIPLTQGYVALVDDADYEELSKYKWSAKVLARTVYAVRSVRKESGGFTHAYMHRVIMGNPEDMEVDHRDGNGLNNVRANLRLATRANNRANSRKVARKTRSRFKGIVWTKDLGKWSARIRDGKKTRYIGYFDTEEEAARAYDQAARAKWGEYARLNFPKDGEQAA